MKLNEPNVSPKDKLVATLYCGEALGNAERACVLAGYSPRYARGNAYKVVARSGVQEYIKYLNSLTADEEIADISEIQKFWTGIMRSGAQETKDRLRASELLAKIKQVDEW